MKYQPTSQEVPSTKQEATLLVPNENELHTAIWRKKVRKFFTKNRFALIALLIGGISVLTGYIVQQRPLQPSQAALMPSALLLTPSTRTVPVGATVTGSLFIIPQTNAVLGADVILTYDPAYLKLTNLTPSNQLKFGTIKTTIDQFSGTITIAALTYLNGLPQPPVTDVAEIATFSFQALQATTATTIQLAYVSGSSTDSNIVVASGISVVDTLQNQPQSMTVAIAVPTNTPVPPTLPTTPTTTPIITPTPTLAPIPTTPATNPTTTPIVTPTHTPIPTPTPPRSTETLTIVSASIVRIFKNFTILVVKATDSLAPKADLTVLQYGKMRYSVKTNMYTGVYFISSIPASVIVTSSEGAIVSTTVTM